jgi:hypothetical protein
VIALAISGFVLVALPITAKPTQVALSTKSSAALIALTRAFQTFRTVTSTFDPFTRTQNLDSLHQRIEDSAARSDRNRILVFPFHFSPNFRCLFDFLSTAAYRRLSSEDNVFIRHNYESFDDATHKYRWDWDLFAKIKAAVLPELAKDPGPFVLRIANADSHAIPRSFVDPRCHRRLPGAPTIVRSFDCADQIVERFVKAVKESPLFPTTDLLLYRDHVLMGENYKQISLRTAIHRAPMVVSRTDYNKQTSVAARYCTNNSKTARSGI